MVRDVEGERAVGAVHVALERSRVEEIALERIRHQMLGLGVVHGEGREGPSGRELPLSKRSS